MKSTGKFRCLPAALLLMLFCCSLVSADVGTSNIDEGVQRVFTAEQGLMSTSTTAIAQTDDGFIWIGGYGGLVRYDGKTFVPWGAGTLSNITDLLPGSGGALYIGSVDQGLVLLESGRLSFLTPADSGEVPSVECLGEAPSGAVWFGTDSGIGRYSAGEGWQMLPCPELEEQKITDILCESDAAALCVTQSGGFFRYDRKKESCEPVTVSGTDEPVRSLARARGGDYYLGTSGSTVVHCGSDFKVLEVIATGTLATVNQLVPDENGSVWICTDSGVGLFRDGTVEVQNLEIDNSVDRMMIDAERNFWFASSRLGVLEVARSRFGNVSRRAGLGTLVVNAVAEAEDRIYIGHDSGLVILDAENFGIISDPEFDVLNDVRIRCVCPDSEGGLWFCTKGMGLLQRTADGTWKTYNSAQFPEIGSDNFRCITETEDGMIAGSDAGAYRIRDGKVENVLRDSEVFRGRVLSVMSRGGRLYLGTDGYGLFQIRDGEVERHYTREDGLGSNVIMKLCRGRTTDDIWMVTGNEIVRLDAEGSLVHLEGFPSTNNLDMIFTDSGNVWIPSGTGIFLTDEESLTDNDFDEIRQFRKSDGMPFEVTANSYQFMDGHTIYLCGSGGLMTLDAGVSGNREPEYPVVFDVIVDDEPVLDFDGSSVTMASDARRIELFPHVLTYGLEDPKVRFMLRGFDEWETERTRSDLGSVTYTNLDGGEYEFSLRAGESEYVLTIDKQLRLTEEKWFKVLLSLGVLLLIGLATYVMSRLITRRGRRVLQRKMEQEQKEHLEEIAYKDYLTGLYSRNYLEIWTERGLQEKDYPVSFLMLDCNRLKNINDNFGHKTGDLLLKTLADLLKEEFIDPRFTVLRNGGDEFLVLAKSTGMEEARKRVAELRKTAAESEVGGRPITFSAGICTMTEENYDFDYGLGQSDTEMLKEKAAVHGRRI